MRCFIKEIDPVNVMLWAASLVFWFFIGYYIWYVLH
jgi:hypothetical protein